MHRILLQFIICDFIGDVRVWQTCLNCATDKIPVGFLELEYLCAPAVHRPEGRIPSRSVYGLSHGLCHTLYSTSETLV